MPKKFSDLTKITALENTSSFLVTDPISGSDRRITRQDLEEALDLTTQTELDDKASLLQADIDAAAKGYKPFETKTDMDAFTPGEGDPEIAQVMNDPTTGNNGVYRWDGTSWIKRDSLAEVKDVKGWVSNILDGYGVDTESLVYSDAGNLQSGNFTWPDNELGSFSNLSENNGDFISLRLNRPNNKYITVFEDGNLTATGY